MLDDFFRCSLVLIWGQSSEQRFPMSSSPTNSDSAQRLSQWLCQTRACPTCCWPFTSAQYRVVLSGDRPQLLPSFSLGDGVDLWLVAACVFDIICSCVHSCLLCYHDSSCTAGAEGRHDQQLYMEFFTYVVKCKGGVWYFSGH